MKNIKSIMFFVVSAVITFGGLSLAESIGFRHGYCKALNGRNAFINGHNYCVINNDYNHPISYPED